MENWKNIISTGLFDINVSTWNAKEAGNCTNEYQNKQDYLESTQSFKTLRKKDIRSFKSLHNSDGSFFNTNNRNFRSSINKRLKRSTFVNNSNDAEDFKDYKHQKQQLKFLGPGMTKIKWKFKKLLNQSEERDISSRTSQNFNIIAPENIKFEGRNSNSLFHL